MSLIHINNGDSGLDTRNKINNAFDMIDNLSTGSLINVTYSEAVDLISNSNLNEGFHYKITDRADAGIILLAVSTNQFSLEGQGIFLNPDFQGAGALSADVQGVWYVGGEAGYVNGNIVFWNGNHYEVTDDAAFAGKDPSDNSLAYTLLSKSVVNGYIEEVDFILYDFVGDSIFKRQDKRGNDINTNYVNSFQWGNDVVTDVVVVKSSDIDIQNQRGSISRIKIQGQNNGYLSADNNFTGVFVNNYIFETSISLTGAGAFISGCSFEYCQGGIYFNGGESYNSKQINQLGSTFEATIDLTMFSSGTLTIPTNLNYIGIFTNQDIGGNIDEIVNLPNHLTTFKSIVGVNYSFVHSNVAGATINQLISDAATTNTIVGAHNDFIQYNKVVVNGVNVNQRYNAVIAA